MWHLATDTPDTTSGSLSAALKCLRHNDTEAGKKKKKEASKRQGGFPCLHIFCEVVCIFLKLYLLSFQQRLQSAYIGINKCMSLIELNKVDAVAIFRTTYEESLILWEHTGIYTHIYLKAN